MRTKVREMFRLIEQVSEKCSTGGYAFAMGWTESIIETLPDTEENRAWVKGEIQRAEKKLKEFS